MTLRPSITTFIAVILFGSPAFSRQWDAMGEGSSFVLKQEKETLTLACDTAGNGVFQVEFENGRLGNIVRVLSNSGRVRFRFEDDAVRQSAVDAEEWELMISIFEEGGNFNVTSSANQIVFTDIEPLIGFAC